MKNLEGRVAAGFGAAGVMLGALGAHGPVARILQEQGTPEYWKTAVFYHLTHSVLLVLLAGLGLNRRAWICFCGGIVLFSGSLYLLALSGIQWLGAVTPFGGLLLILGWILLLLRPLVGKEKPQGG